MATSTAASTSASSPASALSASWREHSQRREQRRHEQARLVEQCLTVADEVENNCRAALGLQLNAAVSNQGALEATVRDLRLHVAGLARRCAAHGAAYEQLAAASLEVAGVGAHLRATDAILARVGANLEFIGARLTAED
jgi:hypothetical protein